MCPTLHADRHIPALLCQSCSRDCYNTILLQAPDKGFRRVDQAVNMVQSQGAWQESLAQTPEHYIYRDI